MAGSEGGNAHRHPDSVPYPERFGEEGAVTVGRRRQPVFRGGAERQALMAAYRRRDGARIGSCKAKGLRSRTLTGWFARRRRPAPCSGSPAQWRNRKRPWRSSVFPGSH